VSLKRDELIAMNSIILHEILGDQSEPGFALEEDLARELRSNERWRTRHQPQGGMWGKEEKTRCA
jgi:hypothetical protein